VLMHSIFLGLSTGTTFLPTLQPQEPNLDNTILRLSTGTTFLPTLQPQEPNLDKLVSRLQHICNQERVRIDKAVGGGHSACFR